MNNIGLVLDGTDRFIRPIANRLQQEFHLSIFQPRFVRLPLIGIRVNELLLDRQLRRFLHKHDLVFFEWGGPLAALASRQSYEGKRIVRVHRTELYQEHLSGFNWSNIDAVIVVSGEMRARLLDAVTIPEEHVVKIPNGIDLTRYVPVSRKFSWRIGMLGNLTARKRVYDIICSLMDLPAEIPWELSIGGKPSPDEMDYWIALQSLVDRLGARERVSFEGHVNKPWLWFQDIDIFLSASYSEGHQVSLLEALASGCYCLGHCWAGIEETLVEEQIFTTSRDLRERLVRYGHLPEEGKRALQTQMRQLAEAQFDEQRMIGEIVDLVQALLEE